MSNRDRTRAGLALALLVPAPTVGVLFGLWILPGTAGQIVWAITKIWLFGLPVAWHVLIDRQRPRFPMPRREGLAVGLISGLLIGGIIVGGYWLTAQQLIDLDVVRQRAAAAGLDHLGIYIAMVLYSSFINALLEEYAWRWFVFRKCELILKRGGLAVFAAGLLFTLHHVVALAAYFGPAATTLASIGVLIGGLTWSALYLKYRSIWPGYVSHVIADLALFGVGYVLIFS